MNIHEAKTNFSKLIERVANGEEIIISKAGTPVAKLVPYSARTAERTGGFLAGQIWEAPDCWEPDESLEREMFDAPLLPRTPVKYGLGMKMAEETPRPKK